MHMQEGSHTFYAIKHRCILEGKHLDLESELEPCEDSWHYSGGIMNKAINSHIGSGNDWRPKNREASTQYHDLRMATGHTGCVIVFLLEDHTDNLASSL